MDLLRRTPPQNTIPSKEMELLISCARMHIDEPTAARIRELAGREIDWPKLRELSNRHRVMPLLYRSLYTTCPELVPGEALGGLRQDYQANAARNMFLKRELLKILGWFEVAGIQAIPFKGPILAEQAYGDLALRQFADLDILIQECDILKARDLMHTHSYEPVYEVVKAAGDRYLRQEGEYAYGGRESGVGVELHWHLVPRSFIRGSSLEQMIFESLPISHGLPNRLSLSQEDMLLVLCMHGARHEWTRMGWLCDLSEQIGRMREISWDELFERAEEINCQRILHLGLWLIQERLGVELPEAVSKSIRSDPAVILLEEAVAERLLSDDYRELGFIKGTRFQLRIRRRLSDRIGYVTSLFTTPSLKDWAWIRLPPRLEILYILLRPIRLISKWR